MNKKFIIEEDLWEIMQPLLPKKKSIGRPRYDDCKVMNGIFYLLRTGCQWAALPNCFGKKSTVYGRFIKLVSLGFFEKLRKEITRNYFSDSNICKVWYSIDASLSKAPRGGFLTGKNPTDRRKSGIKKTIIVDRQGAPVGFSIGAANRHDSQFVEKAIESFKEFLSEELRIITGDSAYDSVKLKKLFLKNNFIPIVSENIRNSKDKQTTRKHPLHRWIVERTHAWLNHYRSVFTRWTRRYDTFEAMFAFACSCRVFQMTGVFG